MTEHLMKKLRMRRGLDGNDTSEDDHIERMSPADKVRDLAGWELGYGGWADTFAMWMRECEAMPEDFGGE
jgi:hypothetical protein